MAEAETFEEQRARLMELMLTQGSRTTKRFLNLDQATYRDGLLPARQKELLGLIASAVLRCDDCIIYHLRQCRDAGWSADEIRESLEVALGVGGSITIPHVRRAYGEIDSWGPADAPAS
jgi:AhpD family alkylhydroperoxidase